MKSEGVAVTEGGMICMEPDAVKVLEIIKGSKRFSDPLSDPCGYYIWTVPQLIMEGRKEAVLQFYQEKLRYASIQADAIIQNAFQPVFYEFYGVDRTVIESPEDMCRQLIFDSFVLVTEHKTINACLSNDVFMFGHYIESCWDYDWNLMYSQIC